MHTGIDWVAPPGTPVIAAANGKVIRAEFDPTTGKTITIDHGNGWETRYAHLRNLLVLEGACVQLGALIGTVGKTGLAYGTHLHFEVLRDNQFVNPRALKRP